MSGTNEPYLSVVVTTRNDDHGGDPLKRLQAFINCFDAQCRRTGLDAEVIVVEWNPPPDRPWVSSLVELPNPSACTYRFIEVPPALHDRLKYADVLPLFQMIAKNVGIRRARGRFVLATNIDIIFSNELVEYLASRQLRAGTLYRVDRHDIDSDFPVNAPLEAQMAYCASHQIRVHTRWGSSPVDREGRVRCLSEDIADGCGVRLGEGWHVRENALPGRVFRWATDRAALIVDTQSARITDEPVLDLEVESNPYDPLSWVELAVCEGERMLAQTRVSGRMRLRLPLGLTTEPGPRRIDLCVADKPSEWRRQLPIFERREAMFYRVYSATVTEASTLEHDVFEYPLDRWSSAFPDSPALTMRRVPEGLEVTSDPRKLSYVVRYGPLRAPRRGVCRIDVVCTILEGRIGVGVLSSGDTYWLPSTVTQTNEDQYRRFEVAVELRSGEECSVVVYNDHPSGAGVSRFVIRLMRGSCEPAEMLVERRARSRYSSLIEWCDVAYAKAMSRLRPVRGQWASRLRTRNLKSAVAGAAARLIGSAIGSSLRYRIATAAPAFVHLEQALRVADDQLRKLAPVQDLAELHRQLRDRRPDNLHVNGCGDFQLMAIEHWQELRAYPEFETFSMNIDGLFSYIADAAGVREAALPMPIYHLEHEVGSGWSPEGEALLRKRIAERGVTWLDASTVYIWAAYMRWLQRPMIFNGADWGMAAEALPERTPAAACPAPS
jgi:hypothetical protein